MEDRMDYNGQPSITIDTGLLPTWPVLQSMNVAYSGAVVRLQNALSLTELFNLLDFRYRFHVSDPVTGERRVVVQRGGENSREAVLINWSAAISILAILQLKNYTATYGESKVVGLFFSFPGEGDRKSDMDKLMLLFDERHEFEMFNLSNDLEVNTDGEEETEEKE